MRFPTSLTFMFQFILHLHPWPRSSVGMITILWLRLVFLPVSGAESLSWSVTSWRTADGLPQNTVHAIEQTPDGYLWVGTRGGLARFDGVRFKTYGLEDGLKDQSISSLLEDGRGGLWVGTYGGGLSHHRDGIFTTLTKGEGFADNSVLSLAHAAGSGVWVGGKSGLQLWDGDHFIMIGEPEILRGKKIVSLATGPDGTLWVSTSENGLFRLRKDRFEVVTGPGGTLLDKPYLLASRDGALWAGIGNGKLLRYHEEMWTEFNQAHGVPFSVIRTLAEGPSGEVWIGSAEEGLHVLRDGKFQVVSAGTGGPNPAIRAVMVGRQGVAWVGSQAGGLSRVTLPRVTDHPVGGPGRRGQVNGLVEEPPGQFWVTTFGGGLFRGPLDRLEPFESAQLAANPYLVSGLHLQRGGALFFGPRQLLVKSATGRDLRNLEVSENWSSACESEAGAWLGTFDGELWHRTDGLPQRVEGASFPSGIAALARESRSAVWVATSHSGLYLWEAGQSRHWGAGAGLPNVPLKSLHRDAAGTLWIGTEGGGLFWLREGQIRSVNVRQGLGDNYVVQILEEDGNLWLGCYRGIFRVSKSELEDVAAGRAAFVHPLALDESDGMAVAECSGYHCPAGLKSSNGSLLFSTARGVVEVDPDRFRALSPPPPVRIEEFLVDGKVNPRGETPLSIPPGPHEVEIRYTAFAETKPERIRFRHRLAGSNAPWIDAGTTRSARLILPPPGKYRFEVGAANQDGRWLEEPAAVDFIVQPHLWQTLGFRISMVVALVASGGAVVAWLARHRIRRAREREQLARAEAEVQQHLNEVAHLTRVATLGELSSALAHELSQPLTAILCNAELARMQLATNPLVSNELKEIIQDIINDDRRASEVIRGMHTLLKKGEFQPEPVNANEVIGEVLRMMKGDLISRNVATTTQLGTDLPLVRADRVQLQQVLINLMQNAADAMAECPPGQRTLSIRSARDGVHEVVIAVLDSGPGVAPGQNEKIFDPYETTKVNGLGLGLPLSRSIIFAHGGKLWAANRPEGGAAFSFTLHKWKSSLPERRPLG